MRDSIRQPLAIVLGVLLVVSMVAVTASVGGDQYSPAQNASASHGGADIDDFEDNDTTVAASGWSGWTGATGSLSTESADPISGSHSGKLEAVDSIDAVSAEADSAQTPNRIATKFRISTASGSVFDGYKFRAESGSTKVMEVYFEPHSQAIKVNNGGTQSDTGKDWHGGAVYQVEFRDIDFSNDTYDLYLNGEQWHDDAAFANSVSDIDNVTVESDTNNAGADPVLYFDDVETDGVEYSTDRFSSGAVDTVEDNDTNIEATGWYGYANATSALSTESDSPLHGDHSLSLTANGDVQEAQISSVSGLYKPSRLAVAINITEHTGSQSDGFKVIAEKGSTRLFWIYFEPNSKKIKWQKTDTGLRWQKGGAYHIEFRDINWSAGTYDLYIDAVRIVDDVSFDTDSTEGFDVLTIESDADNGAGDATIVFDNVEVDGGSHSSGWSDGLTDDVENGKVSYERAGWPGEWEGTGIGETSVNSSGPLAGSHSLTFANNGDQDKIWTASITQRKPTSIKWTVSVDDQFGNEFDHEHFQFEKSTSDLARHAMEVRLSHDGNVEVADGSSFVDADTWSGDQTYTFEIKDIDWSSHTYDVYMDGSRIQDDASFGNNVDSIQRFRLHSDHDSSTASTSITIDDLEFGYMSSSDFDASEPTTSTGTGGSDEDTTEYEQTFRLDSDTPTIRPSTATLTAAYWTKDGERTNVTDPSSPRLRAELAGSTVDLENTEFEDSGFNFENETTETMHHGNVYDLVVEDESCGGWWRTSGFIGDRDRGIEVLEPDDSDIADLGVLTTCAADDPATVTPTPEDDGSPGSHPRDPSTPIPTVAPPDPTLNVNVVESAFDDCWAVHVSYYDPSGQTTEISYSFTADGEDYSDTITFDDPISLFSDRIHQAKFDPDIEEEDCASGVEPPDVGNGTVDFNFSDGGGGSLAFESFGTPSIDGSGGGFVPSGGDGGGGVPLPLWALVAALVAYYYRKPERRQAVRQAIGRLRP